LPELLSVQHVNKMYGIAQQSVQALRDVSFNAQQGDLIGIIGKSGAGKSTLINLLAGIDRPTSGTITIMNADLSEMREDRLAVWRGMHIGVVYQTFQLLEQLTVLDNILLAMDLCGNYRENASREAALRILRNVEIEEQAYKLPSQISGGQKQRAAIARALANDPPLLLADEPTGNLDTLTADHIFGLFHQLASAGRTVIVVTHDRSRHADFSSVYNITDGEIQDAS